jgi:hypothetical protein
MRARLRATALGAMMMAITGCAAIFNGTRQNITATSAPDAATIAVEPGGAKYTTPASMSLERKNEYNLTFTKDGYSSGVFHVEKHLNGGMVVLDVLFTGLVGVVVDAATGAWYNLDPATAQVVLTKAMASVPGPDTIRVAISKRGDQWHVESSTPGVIVEVKPR